MFENTHFMHCRVKEEKGHLEEELDQVRREYEGLRERHDQYVQDYGPDGEETQRG